MHNPTYILILMRQWIKCALQRQRVIKRAEVTPTHTHTHAHLDPYCFVFFVFLFFFAFVFAAHSCLPSARIAHAHVLQSYLKRLDRFSLDRFLCISQLTEIPYEWNALKCRARFVCHHSQSP